MLHSKKTLVWFRKDLRLSDNPALWEACQQGEVLPIYILEEKERAWSLGAAQTWWLYHSLQCLQADLRRYNTQIVLRKGNPLSILLQLAKETDANAVFWNRCYEPQVIASDMQVQQQLQREGIEVRSFSGNLLFDPENISNQSGSFFKVFTPFWRHCVSSQHPRSLYPIPTIRPFEHVPQSVDIATWSSLLPQNPNWSQKFTAYWKPGERHGHQLLAAFAEKTITTYAKDRDFPSLQGTSRLSPYLHFGELSPHQVWYKVQEIGTGNVLGADAERYLAEIGWREFAYHLLYHCPTLPSQPFNHKFDTFPWQFDATLFNKWKRGMTGYPIVDAGMRELWESGWMHNRVRMVVASFLTKHLLIPWQAGAEWFLDTLLDADLANNAAGWQWVAGCGADAAPYFRVFNPVMQGKKFDPSGKYIRRWIPELRALPDGYIHSPWEASSNVLAVSDVQLGNTYPNSIVEHAFARKRALEPV